VTIKFVLTRALTQSFLIVICLTGAFSSSEAQSLRGSERSLDLQNQVARQHDFTYIRTPGQVDRFVKAGYLVRVPNSQNYWLKSISFPYARPEVALFIARLGSQYRSACGEQLVVTSLTRPTSRQPRNASPRSVHPTGMALDLRRPSNPACRSWLSRVLLQLEGSGVLEVSEERRPPHYHVAVFPTQYASYVQNLRHANEGEYRVRRGDSLWEIAKRHDTTVTRLRSANQMSGSRIYPGQVLSIPN